MTPKKARKLIKKAKVRDRKEVIRKVKYFVCSQFYKGNISANISNVSNEIITEMETYYKLKGFKVVKKHTTTGLIQPYLIICLND